MLRGQGEKLFTLTIRFHGGMKCIYAETKDGEIEKLVVYAVFLSL